MIWVCRLNDCNKRFARETDLKRHQATSKAHRNDAELICCPQCDSTFTRTDALKRHQRSRHNGGPGENAVNSNNGSVNGEADGSASSTPQSRSMSPGQSEGQNQKSSHSQFIPVPTIMTQPEAPGRPTGTQSYYPPEVVNPLFFPSQLHNGHVKAQDSPIPSLPLPPPTFQSWMPVSWAVDPNTVTQPLAVPYPQSLPCGFFASGTPIPGTHTILPQPDGGAGKGDTMTSLFEQSSEFSGNNIDPSLQVSSRSAMVVGDEQDGSEALKNREDAYEVLKAVFAFDAEDEMTQLGSETSTSNELEEELQRERTHDNETSSLPEGIRELINEDSLSYAPPS